MSVGPVTMTMVDTAAAVADEAREARVEAALALADLILDDTAGDHVAYLEVRMAYRRARAAHEYADAVAAAAVDDWRRDLEGSPLGTSREREGA